jgi:hypothetical protein
VCPIQKLPYPSKKLPNPRKSRTSSSRGSIVSYHDPHPTISIVVFRDTNCRSQPNQKWKIQTQHIHPTLRPTPTAYTGFCRIPDTSKLTSYASALGLGLGLVWVWRLTLPVAPACLAAPSAVFFIFKTLKRDLPGAASSRHSLCSREGTATGGKSSAPRSYRRVGGGARACSCCAVCSRANGECQTANRQGVAAVCSMTRVRIQPRVGQFESFYIGRYGETGLGRQDRVPTRLRVHKQRQEDKGIASLRPVTL